MRWIGNWWGVVLLADDEADVTALTTLSKLLSPKALHSYDHGECELKAGPFIDDYYDEYKCLMSLAFKG